MREIPRAGAQAKDGAVPEVATDWGMVAVSTAKDVLDAVDTLPCIKIIAGVASTILDTVQVRGLPSVRDVTADTRTH
jgi:hypothetical protein